MWTYSGDPTSSPKDKLRFDIGDTLAADPLLQDEEIAFCLSSESTYNGAVARACESIAMRFQREASTKVGALSLDLATRAQQWSQRADMYRKRANASHAPYVGGLSKAEKAADESNPDKTGPYFRKDMMRDRWLY
ncbi:hypothetical protein AAC03nite_20190 [Alicyclobacillus acidoterrestris]|nr:hypothetical protein AAC03nite_20190 [Alicyclobacillus acidoterrestris]